MHRGYIKKWRKALDSEAYSHGLKAIGLFDCLLLRANHKEGYFQGQRIMPGQLVVTVASLAYAYGETPKVIRGLLGKLESAGAITANGKANRYTIITICAWDSYQNTQTLAGQTERQPESRPRRNQGQRSKNEKKETREEGDSHATVVVASLLDTWKRHFPEKTQPRPGSISAKIATRIRSDAEWGTRCTAAIEHAAGIPALATEGKGWFQFEWLCRNATTVSKVLTGTYDFLKAEEHNARRPHRQQTVTSTDPSVWEFK